MTDSPLVLSIFPGIDLLGRAFEEEGFTVVRGPDLLWGGDIKTFHPPAGKLDGVIGGPPCQAFSRLRHLVEHNGYDVAPNLIPEFERCIVEAVPTWFVMENVPQAPMPQPRGYTTTARLLNNRWLGEDQNRVRRFTFGDRQGVSPWWHIEFPVFESQTYEPAVCASGGARPVPVAVGGSGKVKRSFTERHTATRKGASAMGYKTAAYLRDALRLQGLPENFLADAPFTVAGKIECVGNGVPLALGRAVARAVRQSIGSVPEAPSICELVTHGKVCGE